MTLLGPVILLCSALLAAGYLLPIVINGFFTSAGQGTSHEKYEPKFSMILPMVLLAAASVFFGISSGGLIAFIEQIANLVL